MIRILVYAESFLEGGRKEWSPLGTTEWLRKGYSEESSLTVFVVPVKKSNER